MFLKMVMIICGFSSVILGQEMYQFRGKVIDKETEKPLAGVNIYFPKTLEGTISDIQGDFVLWVKKVKNVLPKIKVSYVGYKEFEAELRQNMLLRLEEDVHVNPTVVVTAKKINKGKAIVLNTIENYQERFSKVNSFEIDVYSKFFFHFPKGIKTEVDDDALLDDETTDELGKEPWVFEAYKRINYEKPGRLSQVLLKRNQGKVVPKILNVFGIIDYQNIFNEPFLEERSPLSENSLDAFFYTYGAREKLLQDSVSVVYAESKNTESVWIYKMWIDDEYTLKKIEIGEKKGAPKHQFKLSELIELDDVQNISVIQTYVEIEGIIMPKNYIVSRVTKGGTLRFFEDYKDVRINKTATEGVTFGQTEFRISRGVDADRSEEFWEQVRSTPLSPIEERSYVFGDSLYQTLDGTEKFFIRDGFDLLFLDYKLLGFRTMGFSDFYHFNPVVGHYAGIGLKGYSDDILGVRGTLGYGFGSKRMYGTLSLSIPILYSLDIYMTIFGYDHVRPLQTFGEYKRSSSTILGLFFHESDFNYLQETGVNISLSKQVTNFFSYGLIYRNKKYSGVENTSEYSFFKRGKTYPYNLRVDDTNEYEFGVRFLLSEERKKDFGFQTVKKTLRNPWHINGEIVFDVNDWEHIYFKRATLSLFKINRLSKNIFLNINSNIYYQGKNSNLANVIFPRGNTGIINLFEERTEYSLAGWERFREGGFDYFSVGANLEINNILVFFGFFDSLGTISLFGQAFRINNYGIEYLQKVSIANTTLDFNYGISLSKFLPKEIGTGLKFIYSYNTKVNTGVFLLRLVQELL